MADNKNFIEQELEKRASDHDVTYRELYEEILGIPIIGFDPELEEIFYHSHVLDNGAYI